MKKTYKRIIGLTSLSLIALTLASCDSKRNTKTPTGTLDLSKTYASVQNGDKTYSLTYEEMYNRYRTNGYSTMLAELKKKVLSKEMSEATYASNKKRYNDAIISAIFGSSSISTFTSLHETDDETYEEKIDSFITNQLSDNGYDYSNLKTPLKSLYAKLKTSDKDDFDFDISEYLGQSWPETLIDQYKYNVACYNLSLKYVKQFADSEKIYDYENEKMITNSNYIKDENIESSYKSTYYSYNKTKAIIIKFKNNAEAEKYVAKINESVGTLSDTNKEAWYLALYNEYHKDKKQISADSLYDDENEKETVFYKDANHTDLSSTYSTDLETYVYDTLEDGDYLVAPRNIDGSYYMVYRNNVTYYYGNGEGEDYSTVSSTNVDNLGNKIEDSTGAQVTLKEYIKEKLIESKASESNGDTLVLNRIKYNSTIEIYDPVYENQFYNSYSDYYSFTKNFDSNLIFKVTYTDDNFTHDDTSDDTSFDTQSYSVSDFFDKLDKTEGVSNAITLLQYKYLLDTDLHYMILDSTWDGYKDTAKETISNFKKNKTAYSKKMGLDNYLVLTYGITSGSSSEDALTNYLRGQALVSSYYSYYGYFIADSESETGSTFADSNNLFKTLKKYSDTVYDKYYSMSVNHILISVDPVANGTHVDPRNYIEDLNKLDSTGELTKKFKQAILELTQLLYNELDAITATSTTAMTYLAKTYNNTAYDYKLQSNTYGYTSWSDFKDKYSEFNFYLTAEDLSEITTSSSSSYVEEFRDYLQEVATKIASDTSIQDKIEDDEAYLWKEDLTQEDAFDSLCETQYGYHILNIYKYTEKSSCKFESSDDTTSSSSSYKRWAHQEITVSEKDPDTTKDDLIVYASGYSSEDKASMEQLFIYFMENSSTDGVTSMKSSLISAVKTYFSDVMTRYTGSTFQAYRLLQQVCGYSNYDKTAKTYTSLKFFDQNGNESSDKATQLVAYVKELRIACDSSKELEEDSQYYGWFDEDFTTDFSKCYMFHYDE